MKYNGAASTGEGLWPPYQISNILMYKWYAGQPKGGLQMGHRQSDNCIVPMRVGNAIGGKAVTHGNIL